jgi:hypothetical protein
MNGKAVQTTICRRKFLKAPLTQWELNSSTEKNKEILAVGYPDPNHSTIKVFYLRENEQVVGIMAQTFSQPHVFHGALLNLKFKIATLV